MRIKTKDLQVNTIPYPEIIQVLSHGAGTLLKELKSVPKATLQPYYMEIDNILQFLETLSFIQETMSNERLQDTIHNTIHSLRKTVNTIPTKTITQLSKLALDERSGIPVFLVKSIHMLGPYIRISKNEMSAWVRLNSEEAVFYTPDILLSCLIKYGITKGLLENEIQDIFESKKYDEEICIAKGVSAALGEDGRIEYTVEIDDLGQKPKELSAHKVSFKDIKLYEYIAEGQVLARKIPPKPGKPGYTVTNRVIAPFAPQEAIFPKMEFTKISDDDNQLLVTKDCCIKKLYGVLHLEPSLRVSESVSYKTGNVSAKVAVVVDEDVLSGFTVTSEKSIQVGGIVEGATMEAKGNIIIRGGIQGKEKAMIESNADITSKFISNASATALGNIVVESEIVNSKIWAGGQVFVTGHPGHIVGGEIHADSDVVANIIGSELGIKTLIRIGGRAQDLAVMIEEKHEQIIRQEEAVDKCNQIIDLLRMRESQFPGTNDEIKKSLNQAEEMLIKAKENLDHLFFESDSLQKQYEDSLQKSRTVRAQLTIHPGAVIQIQDAEYTVNDTTGPVMFMKQGDEIVQLPYQAIKK